MPFFAPQRGLLGRFDHKFDHKNKRPALLFAGSAAAARFFAGRCEGKAAFIHESGVAAGRLTEIFYHKTDHKRAFSFCFCRKIWAHGAVFGEGAPAEKSGFGESFSQNLAIIPRIAYNVYYKGRGGRTTVFCKDPVLSQNRLFCGICPVQFCRGNGNKKKAGTHSAEPCEMRRT